MIGIERLIEYLRTSQSGSASKRKQSVRTLEVSEPTLVKELQALCSTEAVRTALLRNHSHGNLANRKRQIKEACKK